MGPTPTPSPAFLPSLPGEGDERVLGLLESITDGFCAYDAEWRFTFLNEAARRILGPHIGDPVSLLGRNHWEAFPETQGTVFERECRRAVAEGAPVEFQYLHVPWRQWFAFRGYPIRGGGLSVYFRDITEERQAGEALRESEERYRALFESVDQGFCIVEVLLDERGQPVDHRILETNPAFERHTGLTNVSGRKASEVHPGLEREWSQLYARVVESGESVRIERRSDALRRDFDVNAWRIGAPELRRVAILFSDITQRRETQQQVARLSAEGRARLGELETLLDVLPIGIGIALDRECRNIRVNPAFARVLGISAEVNASKSAPEGDRPANFRIVDDSGREVPDRELPMQVAAREGREIREVEMDVIHADGRTIRLLEYAAPLFDESGEPRGSVGAFVDISERRQMEERQRFLVRLDDAVRPLTEPGGIVAAAARLLGEHLKVDRCAYAGVEADEDTFNLTGDYTRGVPSIIGRYTFTQFGAEALRLMRANEPYVVEDIERHQPAPASLAAYQATLIRAVVCVPLQKDGTFVAAMAVHQKTPRRWKAEEVALVLQVANRCWEALERAKVTRAMEESMGSFHALADNIAQLAWMADAEGWISWYNRRWFDYTGTTLEQMQGWGWERVHHPEHIAGVVEKWSRHLAAGTAWEDTFPLRGADGEYRWFLSRAVPICDADGKVLRWFGTNTDVTEQRLAADALARAKEEAEAANRAKDSFLAALSHELRTPLTPVLLCAAALQEEKELTPEIRAQIAMIRRNIELEARLIDDLLDLTRIARGKLTLRLQACDAHSLLALAIEIVRGDAVAKELALDLDLQARRTLLQCDPARIQQVFWNLLSNAVKYTPRGGRISVRSRDEAGQVVVEVSDTGRGIAPEALEWIFLPFEQAGLTNDHRFGGLGLGLSISKAIVEMHGGTISAQSLGRGAGATFSVQLKATETNSLADEDNDPIAAEQEPVLPGAKPVRSLRLLVVEDHETTLAILSRLLTRDGHAVSTASTVTAARELAAALPFDAVVSDIGLPDGTGIELMEGLRDAYRLRGIALTGYGMDEDLRRSREAGFVAHLIKPVDFGLLRRALAELAASNP